MNRKILSVLTLVIVALNATGLTLANGGPRKAVKKQADPLVAKLPASDAVAVLNARSVFDDALPRLLAANQSMLTSINGHLNEIQTKTGIDLRRFDRVAIGANLKRGTAKDLDVDFVALAQGTLNAGSLIAGAKLASNAGYREERIGDRTVYIFSTKSVADKNLPPSTPGAVNDAVKSVPAEMAVTALDAATLAIGSPARVRETIEARSTVSADLISLLGQRPNPVLAFAARMPEGMRNMLPMDNDELGKNIDSIKYLSGWTDVGVGNASMNVTARSATAESAQSLFETVAFLQQLGKALLGNSKKPENAIFVRLVENAKLVRTGTDVSLDLTVPQSDIDQLIATLNKK